MEPVLGGRDDVLAGWDGPAVIRPQWSPSLADGTTESVLKFHREAYEPQWSPSLADGTTLCPPRLAPVTA